LKFNCPSSLILAILPQAGIGNKLSVWSRALIFSKLNNLQLYTFGWINYRPKNWLKLNLKKRVYFNDFNTLKISDYYSIILNLLFSKITLNPLSQDLAKPNSIYVYNKYDYNFTDLKLHRKLIIDSLVSVLSDHRAKEIRKLKPPLIGIHIRRDDFVKIGYATPLSFYVHVLKQIRVKIGWCIPATIYSDGLESELKDILNLPQVELAEQKSDILDLIELSQSRILITSVGSSFSYWASFISKGITINYQKEWRQYIKSDSNDVISLEWYIDYQNDLPSLLVDQIKEQLDESKLLA
jgi:hypothetical protein